MPLLVSGILVIAGAALMYRALHLTLRANDDLLVPYWRNAQRIPRGSIALRAVGAGLLVLGVVLLSADGGAWVPLLVTALLLPHMIAIPIHNRGVSRGARRSPSESP